MQSNKTLQQEDKIQVNRFNSQEIKQQAKTYDLQKKLQIKIKAKQKCLKLDHQQEQLIPAMISVVAEDVDDIEATEQENQRPGVDLICVIDDSGSMSGEKARMVRETLKILLNFLSKNDRLCLIKFDNHANQLTNLHCIVPENQNIFDNAINDIVGRGGTDIGAGMEIAFKLIQNRKYKNSVTSIFLLSDGQDGAAESKVQKFAQTYQDDKNFTINSFGFGSDHDAKLMTGICKIKNGNFYFIQKISDLDECFADAIGGLMTVVGTEAKIDIKCSPVQPFSGIKISKTYGDYWKSLNQQQYQANIQQLISGVSKDFVFELVIPPLKIDNLDDQMRNVEIIDLIFEITDIVTKEKVSKQEKLIFTIYNENELMEQFDEDEDVMVNYLRVIGAQVIDDARKACEQGKFKEGEQQIEKIIQQFQQAPKGQQLKIENIMNDLKQAKNICQPQQFHQYGQQQMYQINNCHMNQMSQPVQFSIQGQQQQMQQLFQPQQAQQQQQYSNKTQQLMQQKQQIYKIQHQQTPQQQTQIQQPVQFSNQSQQQYQQQQQQQQFQLQFQQQQNQFQQQQQQQYQYSQYSNITQQPMQNQQNIQKIQQQQNFQPQTQIKQQQSQSKQAQNKNIQQTIEKMELE